MITEPITEAESILYKEHNAYKFENGKPFTCPCAVCIKVRKAETDNQVS